MRACDICGIRLDTLYPLRVSTAVRWACEWCLRDQRERDWALAGEAPQVQEPGDPDGEAPRGGEAAAQWRDAEEALRKWK